MDLAKRTGENRGSRLYTKSESGNFFCAGGSADFLSRLRLWSVGSDYDDDIDNGSGDDNDLPLPGQTSVNKYR